MKRRGFLKCLEAAGFTLLRHGAALGVYARGDEREYLPRHGDVNENFARAILKRRGA